MMLRSALYRLQWALLAVCSMCGCISQTPSTDDATLPRPPEPAWEEQVARVRSSTSTAIRSSSSPVSSAQWAMLNDGCDALTILEADTQLLTAADWHILRMLPELQRLKLAGPIDDVALREIAGLSSLQILNLPDGTFSDESLQDLAALSELELLRFGSPRVTDDGLEVVTRLPELRFLHLIDVPVTDEGLQYLHQLSQLESFYLDGGGCTDAGLYGLLQALPQLHFHRDQLHLPEDPHAHPHETSGISQ